MAVSDGSGAILYRFVYDTYGELSDITTDDGISLKKTETLDYTLAELADAIGIDYLYNGQYGVITDRNGLYYMRARYYDQDIKRFINRDIVAGSITESQSLNRYCYVQGNPVNLTDPFGLCPDPSSNFRNFCKVLYYMDWNSIGHAALDVAGIFFDPADLVNAAWYAAEGNTKEATRSMICALPFVGETVGGLMMKTQKLAKAGRAVKAVSKLARGGMGITAGIQMFKTSFTNILNGLESGDLSAGDILGAVGGAVITGLSGKGMMVSGRDLQRVYDVASKASKAEKASQVKWLDTDVSGKTIEEPVTTGDWGDYSHRFQENLNTFNSGYEIKTEVEEDLILVQYTSNAPNSSMSYWTTLDEANAAMTLEQYMDRLAISSTWGNRNVVKVARIKSGTKIRYAVGTARKQDKVPDPRPGGGVQYMFERFNREWITEERSFPN